MKGLQGAAATKSYCQLDRTFNARGGGKREQTVSLRYLPCAPGG